LQGQAKPVLFINKSLICYLAVAFAGDKSGDKAGNNRTLKQFSYSRLILDLSLPILCEASLTALGWDEGLLRASQKEPSTMKEQVNVKRIYNL
jgi:hypothetical protein